MLSRLALKGASELTMTHREGSYTLRLGDLIFYCHWFLLVAIGYSHYVLPSFLGLG